jgi:hypothetical protein
MSNGNGNNTLPKYQKTFTFNYVICLGSCKQTLAVKQPPSCVGNDALHAFAAQLHGATGLVCIEPKFVINYSENLTDTRILTAAVKE